MKRAFIYSLSACCIAVPVGAQAADIPPEYCGTSGLTEAQEAECLKSKPINSADQVGNVKLEKPKYPTKVNLLSLMDEYNLNKPVEVNLVAESERMTRIQYRNSSPYILVPSDRVVRWGIGEGNKVDASGAIGMAAGAIFFPPMLLAAPFGIRNVKTNQYQIQYLDQYGTAKTLSLTATTHHKDILSILRYGSGLQPGVARDEKEVKDLLRQTLDSLVEQRDKKATELLTSNIKKPWCQYIDLNKNEAAAERYKQLTEYISSLAKRLNIEAPTPKVEALQDEQWAEYIKSKPELQKWVAAYPAQSATLRTCPPISR